MTKWRITLSSIKSTSAWASYIWSVPMLKLKHRLENPGKIDGLLLEKKEIWKELKYKIQASQKSWYQWPASVFHHEQDNKEKIEEAKGGKFSSK